MIVPKRFWSAILLAISTIFILVSPPSTQAEVTPSVRISAFIGKNQVTIHGFTTPNSRVELSSPRVFDVTYTNQAGYFEFDKSILPENPSDLCLTSTDNHSRRSHPVCIPPPPPENIHTDIGPILLPPTITIDSDNIKANSTSLASGQSIPDSFVNIYLYQDKQNPLTFPKETYAYSLPQFTIKTDESGNYSFSLPTVYSSNYRLFATALYQDNNTPKSNTLNYSLPSILYLFWLAHKFLIIFLPCFILTLTLFVYLIIKTLPQPTPRYLPTIRHVSLANIRYN